MHFTFHVPTDVRFGPGRFLEAAPLAARLGRCALIVTTRSAMQRQGHLARLRERLEDEGVRAHVFAEYAAAPTTDDVDAGAALARSCEADVLVAFGGGSALDLGKAVAAVAGGDAPALDYLEGRATPGPGTLPIVTIPTTAGTGSETNRSGIICIAGRPHKDGIRGDALFPRYAVVDPELTHGVDRAMTALTGFDILTHAIESFVSPKAQPIPDGFSRQAVDTVARWLPVVLDQPDHAPGRTALALASLCMGVNLSWVGTCLPHRVDKSICALHPHIAHAQGLALVYPAWARRAVRGQGARFGELADRLAGRVTASATPDAFPDAVTDLLERLDLRRRPQDLGLAADQIPTLVANVAGDTTIDPVPCAREDLTAFVTQVVAG